MDQVFSCRYSGYRINRILRVLLFFIIVAILSVGKEASGNPPIAIEHEHGVSAKPKTQLSKALMTLYPADTEAHIYANILSIEDALDKYGTKDPWAAKAFYELGMCRFRLGKSEEALADFTACVNLPEPFSGLHYNAQNMRMQILRQLNRLDEAIATNEQLEKTPAPAPMRERDQANNLMLRAEMQSQLKTGGAEAAAETYHELIKLAQKKRGAEWDKFTPHAFRGLASRLTKIGNIKEAIAAYDQFLLKYPNDPACALVAMERLRLIRGGKENTLLSIEDLSDILQKYPNNSGARQHVLYELAMAYIRAGLLNDAEKILREMMAFQPTAGDSEYSKSLAATASMDLANLLSQDRVGESLKVLKEIKTRFPEFPEGKYAETYLKQQHAKMMWQMLFRVSAVFLPLIGVLMLILIRRRLRFQKI